MGRSEAILCTDGHKKPSLDIFRSWLRDVHQAVRNHVDDLCMILSSMKPQLGADHVAGPGRIPSSAILQVPLTCDEIAKCITCFFLTRQTPSITICKDNVAACLRLSMVLATGSKFQQHSTLARAFDFFARSTVSNSDGSDCARKLLEACYDTTDLLSRYRCAWANDLLFRKRVALEICGLSYSAMDSILRMHLLDPLTGLGYFEDATEYPRPSMLLDDVPEEEATGTSSIPTIGDKPAARAAETSIKPWIVDTPGGPLLSETASTSSSTKSIWRYAFSLATRRSRRTSQHSANSFDGMSLGSSYRFSRVTGMASNPSLHMSVRSSHSGQPSVFTDDIDDDDDDMITSV